MSLAELYLGPPPEDRDGPGESQYHVRLPDFDGPLDLLLHLVRKNEFDIYDLPIAEITQQYQEMLEIMKEFDLNVAGEFVFMAATLIHIKSKMLLPPPHEDGTEDDLLDDPRAELVARLLEYQRYKEAAQMLHQQETLRTAMWLRPESALGALLPQEEDSQGDMVEVDLFELVSADPAYRSIAADDQSRTLWHSLYDQQAGVVEFSFYLSETVNVDGARTERRSDYLKFALDA